MFEKREDSSLQARECASKAAISLPRDEPSAPAAPHPPQQSTHEFSLRMLCTTHGARRHPCFAGTRPPKIFKHSPGTRHFLAGIPFSSTTPPHATPALKGLSHRAQGCRALASASLGQQAKDREANPAHRHIPCPPAASAISAAPPGACRQLQNPRSARLT